MHFCIFAFQGLFKRIFLVFFMFPSTPQSNLTLAFSNRSRSRSVSRGRRSRSTFKSRSASPKRRRYVSRSTTRSVSRRSFGAKSRSRTRSYSRVGGYSKPSIVKNPAFDWSVIEATNPYTLTSSFGQQGVTTINMLNRGYMQSLLTDINNVFDSESGRTQPGQEKLVFKSYSSKMELVNSYNVPCYVDVYKCSPKDSTTQAADQTWNSGNTDDYHLLMLLLIILFLVLSLLIRKSL